MRFIYMLVVSLILCTSAQAHEIVDNHVGVESEQAQHSFQWFLVPLVTFNALQIGYEFKVSPRIGIKADGALILSMGGAATGGALSASFIAAQGETSTAKHGLEVDVGIASGLYGGGHCNNTDNQCEESAEFTSFTALKGFVGYRLQRRSGFQFRAGVAPFVTAKGDFFALPELTFGTTF